MYPLVQLSQFKYLLDIPLPLKNSKKCIQVNNDVLCYYMNNEKPQFSGDVNKPGFRNDSMSKPYHVIFFFISHNTLMLSFKPVTWQTMH